MPNQAYVILNASSGWSDLAEATETVENILRSSGISYSINQVQKGSDITAIAGEAIQNGSDLIVAGGGDGTLRAVAEAVAGSPATMAVLPVGTLNHFARDMEIPLEIGPAIRIAAQGEPIQVDIGEVNGRVFLNNSVIGLYPAYRDERVEKESRGFRGFVAVAIAIYAAIRRFPFLEIRLDTGADQRVRNTPYILIANNEHAMEGTKPWQRDRLTEGQLWVYVYRGSTRTALLGDIWRLITGRFRAADNFEVVRAREVTIQTRRRAINVSVDGEIVRFSSPLVFRSRPSTLTVMAPPHGKRVQEAL
jgi:diacylglycerol kinase family enzyme